MVRVAVRGLHKSAGGHSQDNPYYDKYQHKLSEVLGYVYQSCYVVWRLSGLIYSSGDRVLPKPPPPCTRTPTQSTPYPYTGSPVSVCVCVCVCVCACACACVCDV